MAFDPAENEALFDAAKEHLKPVDASDLDAGWILPDGSVLDVEDEAHSVVIEENYNTLGIEWMPNVIEDFERRGAIRIWMTGKGRGGMLGVELHAEPTDAQRVVVGGLIREAAKVYLDVAHRSTDWQGAVLPSEFWASAERMLLRARGFSTLGTMVILGGAAIVSKFLGWW